MGTAYKRLIDIALAALFLTISLPVLVVAAIAIKLDSPGPVVYRQARIGRHGRPFIIYKLRSMTLATDSQSSNVDPNPELRVTRTGRILRSLFVDELPQFLNVLRGDMSLVGPRPELPHIVDGYGTLERRRLVVKPGVTGLWQISNCRDEPIHQNLKYDLFYIKKQSLILDARILFATIVLLLNVKRFQNNNQPASLSWSRRSASKTQIMDR